MIERGKFRSLTLINWNGFLPALLTSMNWSRRYPGQRRREIHDDGGVRHGADPGSHITALS